MMAHFLSRTESMQQTSREAPRGGIVEGPAGYGATAGLRAAMPVGEDRIAVRRVRLGAFVSGPPVVRSRGPPIDLLPPLFADVVDEHLALVGLNGKAERVAKPERPDGAVCACSPLVEGIVAGNGAVLVDAQHLPLQAAQGLGVLAPGVLTHSHIELAILTKVYSPSVVVCGTAEVVEPEDELLSATDGSITT